ncbi:MAG: B12-binding domain-containing radical SAM protein, partial [Deltaproteobacteria bacterium]|nr:B12-binding domain-containing radical SAM protein [Deltaproteobacteria bacterium]
MKIALIYPPIVDPTAPYLSVPSLTAYLRKNKVEVLPIDANIEACEFLLTPQYLARLAERIEKQRSFLERKKTLHHREQLAY